ncbi:hypothetical protein UCD39_26410 [Nitrospirillum sp. BR 11752]|uniref:hypothetical protein n=1 Tax=Nitrospirillum sp. BR 11752 TaxID=3104293 RepID=UPI002ECDB299|nr:hypothetical protein [Nitrospirillum sp. BR 11752]
MVDLPALIQPGAIGASLGIQPYTPISLSAAPAGFGSASDLGALANAAAPALPSSVGSPLGSAAQAAQLLGGGGTPSLGAAGGTSPAGLAQTALGQGMSGGGLSAPSVTSPAIPGSSGMSVPTVGVPGVPDASTAPSLSNLAASGGMNTGLPTLPQAPTVATPSLSSPTLAQSSLASPVVATSSATPPLMPSSYSAAPQAGAWGQANTLPSQAPLPSTGNADADSAIAVARILGQI